RAIKTPAEQALNAAYAAARAKLPGKGALADLREAAFQRFDAAGLPHRRIEEGKYTDLRALMREAKPLAETAKAKGEVPALPGLTTGQIAVVNGRYEQAWSNFKPGSGVELSDVFAFAADQKNYRLGEVPGRDDIAMSLNTAFMTGGVALRVAKDAKVDRPVEIAHPFADGAAAAIEPPPAVVLEPARRLTVIQTFR